MSMGRNKKAISKKKSSKRKEPTLTGRAIYDELKAKGSDIRKHDARSQKALYKSLQIVQEREALLNESLELRDDFMGVIKRKRKSTRVKVDLKLELAVTLAGNTRDGRQKASEYCRALRVLDGEDVAPQEISAELKKRGGVKGVIAKNKAAQNKARNVLDDDEEVPRPKRQRTNDVDVPCTVRMSKSMLDGIQEMPRGSEITLNAMVIGQPGAVLSAREIVRKSDDDDVDDDDNDNDDYDDDDQDNDDDPDRDW